MYRRLFPKDKNNNKKTKVCIIGCGISGLTTIKACIEEGLKVTCYEASDGLGGIWSHGSQNEPRAYDELQMNTSRDMSSFSDFPHPLNSNTFLNHYEMHNYLKSYANHFSLYRHIYFEHKVVKAQKKDEVWMVEVQTKDGNSKLRKFDAVIVCAGRFRKPIVGRKIKGIEKFKGVVKHGCKFRSKEDPIFKGKDVLVVGNKFTAGDIAATMSETAKQVYIALGRGTLVISRYLRTLNYSPFDAALLRRSILYDPNLIDIFTQSFEKESGAMIDHEKYSMTAPGCVVFGPFMLNETIAAKIKQGRVIPKKTVKDVKELSVVFDDGTEAHIDIVMYGTGYEIDLSFLDKGLLAESAADLDLYELVFPYKEGTENLAFVGMYAPRQGVVPGIELQARWVARVFAGRCQLPDKETMEATEKTRKEGLLATLGVVDSLMVGIAATVGCNKNNKAKLQPPFVNFPDTTGHYQDRMAGYISVLPTIENYEKTDPELYDALANGPMFAFHYRLVGPHKWPDARKYTLERYNHWKRLVGIPTSQ